MARGRGDWDLCRREDIFCLIKIYVHGFNLNTWFSGFFMKY